MYNNPFIKQEIKILKFGYIIHTLLYILLLISHILIFVKVFWLSKYILQIIFSEIIILSVFTLYPIIILIIIQCKLLTKKMIKILEKISKILLCVFLLNSIFTSATIWYHASLMETFYIHCPFNYKTKDIPNIFFNYEVNNYEQSKKKCTYRKCFPINNNKLTYLCNYRERKNQLEFNEFENKITIREVQSYYNICQNFVLFFTIEKYSFKKYNISYNYICPDLKDILFNDILSIFFIIADVFASSISWLLEFYSYKKIFIFLNYQGNIQNQINQSLRDTNVTSHIENNNNNNNDQNNNGETNNNSNFIRLPTDIIIVENNKSKKDDNNISNENKNNEERIVCIFQKNNNDINNPSIVNDDGINEIKNNDKSEEQIITNQNIFKVLNSENKTNITKDGNK